VRAATGDLGVDELGGRSCRTEEDGARRRAHALRSLTERSGGDDAGVEQSEALGLAARKESNVGDGRTPA
jgi:hypothetical protein